MKTSFYNHFTLIAVFIMLACSAAGQVTQQSIAKKWTYAGFEEFGVVRPPSGNTAEDFLNLNADGTYTMVNEGKTISGSWILNEKSGILVITDVKSKKKFSYTIKSIDDAQLIVEYQSADLVRTKYHYTIK